MNIEEVEIPTHYAKDSQNPTVAQTARYAFSILAILEEYLLHKYNSIFDKELPKGLYPSSPRK